MSEYLISAIKYAFLYGAVLCIAPELRWWRLLLSTTLLNMAIIFGANIEIDRNG